MGGNWDFVTSFVLVAAWLAYEVLRPTKDYYVVQRLCFDRLYEEPWRGKLRGSYFQGFMDYLAAKAAFDWHEGVYDNGRSEGEHNLFMVSAKSKSAAVVRLKAGKAYDKELLHQTPYGDILERRKNWQIEAKAFAEAYADKQQQERRTASI
jgi:hypothetical protein